MGIDSGAIADIISWTTRQWLVIYNREPQNIAALRGIGQTWLSRAQPALSRIHREDGSSPASGSSSQVSAPSRTSSDEE
jgi:hypothetical protein